MIVEGFKRYGITDKSGTVQITRTVLERVFRTKFCLISRSCAYRIVLAHFQKAQKEFSRTNTEKIKTIREIFAAVVHKS